MSPSTWVAKEDVERASSGDLKEFEETRGCGGGSVESRKNLGTAGSPRSFGILAGVFLIGCEQLRSPARLASKPAALGNKLQRLVFVGHEVCTAVAGDNNRAGVSAQRFLRKRFTVGGTIPNKEYFCVPEGEKCKVRFFAPDTAALLYIRYKPAPYQKINQQTCDPSEVEVKGARTRGRQISIKDVSSITAEPTRGWDLEAATTKVMFA
jgi:hypothetical protein